MNCVRCGLFFDSSVPYINAESYGGNVIYACPHCGKVYSAYYKCFNENTQTHFFENRIRS